VIEPAIVPMSDADRQQAVTALAVMIKDWWAREHRDGDALAAADATEIDAP
jgi:hypothetical protein